MEFLKADPEKTKLLKQAIMDKFVPKLEQAAEEESEKSAEELVPA